MLIINPNAVNDIQCKLFKATIMLLSQEQTPLLVSVPSYLKSLVKALGREVCMLRAYIDVQ